MNVVRTQTVVLKHVITLKEVSLVDVTMAMYYSVMEELVMVCIE